MSKRTIKSDYDIELTMKRMRELRIKAKFTQQELGDVMNVPRTYISKWENGKAKPSYEHLVPLYRILHGIALPEGQVVAD
jgi:transcriptional regulator with XRE-family HTH domain